MLTDNGAEFLAHHVEQFLASRGVVHSRIRPAHPWTNGRIERLFRTFKECHRRFSRLFGSRRHLRRFCADFLVFYKHCRPHFSYWALTPDEVFRGEASRVPPTTMELFDGLLLAHRFG